MQDHVPGLFSNKKEQGVSDPLAIQTLQLSVQMPWSPGQDYNLLVSILTLQSEEHVFSDFGNLLRFAKSLQSCLTLCDPTDGSPPGSPVPGTHVLTKPGN